jgi:FkbM family methyltransferase
MPQVTVPAGWQHWADDIISGEYDHKLLDKLPPGPSIGDLGAHWGVFSAWALQRFPGCAIDAYEPHPDNIKGFKKNHTDNISVFLHEGAVTARGGETIKLHIAYDSGSHSLLPFTGNIIEPLTVKVIDPKDLPQFQILKLDIEGLEPEVIAAYMNSHMYPECIMYEYHDIKPYVDPMTYLNDDYDMIKHIRYHTRQGVMIFMLKGYLPNA